jgi:hypothetical protein
MFNIVEITIADQVFYTIAEFDFAAVIFADQV